MMTLSNRLLLLLLMTMSSTLVSAKPPVVEVIIRNHLFYPSTVTIPANTKIKLLVVNEDATAEEFESYELNREKVIAGKQKAVIFIGPLRAGSYPFFGEFHPNTAQGMVVAE
jgi:plastocyanin